MAVATSRCFMPSSCAKYCSAVRSMAAASSTRPCRQRRRHACCHSRVRVHARTAPRSTEARLNVAAAAFCAAGRGCVSAL